MSFKVSFFAVAFFMTSCASDEDKSLHNTGAIGTNLSYMDSVGLDISLGYQTGTKRSFSLNHDRTQVYVFDVNAFKLHSVIDIPELMQVRSMVVSPNEKYQLLIGRRYFAILGQGNKVHFNPVELPGDVKSIAYDPEGHKFLVADEFGSMALLLLSEAGGVEDSWLAGPIFSDSSSVVGTEETVFSGDFLRGGPLVLAIGGEGYLSIDADASVKEKKWVYEHRTFDFSHEGDEDKEEQEAPIVTQILSGDDSSYFWIKRSGQLHLVQTQTGKVKKSISLQGKQMSLSRLGTPHLYIKDLRSGHSQVLRVDRDGSVLSKRVSLPSSLGLGQTEVRSVWDTEEDQLILLTNRDGFSRKFFKMRLSDGLVLSAKSIESEYRVTVTQKYLILNTDSILGYAKRWSQGKKDIEVVLQGFNYRWE